jgi:mannose-1-phosphate guanylyltransferase/mannose-6-phosphate isomerase
VILSGGSGTRLWPLSRELLPKQLLALTGERTMIQETAARLMGFSSEGFGDATAPVVVCNEAHRFLVAEQLREMGLPPSAILLEPVGRNTAPAIALAAHAALQVAGGGALILVPPPAHVLADPPAFQAALQRALVLRPIRPASDNRRPRPRLTLSAWPPDPRGGAAQGHSP